MIRLKSLERQNDSHPNWRGVGVSGERFYASYRAGFVTAYLDGQVVYSRRHGHEYDYTMTDETLLEILKDKVEVVP